LSTNTAHTGALPPAASTFTELLELPQLTIQVSSFEFLFSVLVNYLKHFGSVDHVRSHGRVITSVIFVNENENYQKQKMTIPLTKTKTKTKK